MHPLKLAVLIISLASPAIAQPCEPAWQPGAPGTSSFVFAAAEWDPDGPGPLESGIVMGGTFHIFASNAHGLAFWDGSSYTGFGNKPGVVRALAVLPDGDLVAGGDFDPIDGVPGTSRIARWDIATSAWMSIGGGVTSGAAVESLAVLSDGSLVAVGLFNTMGGSPASGVALWNGTTWSGLGGSLDCYPPRGTGDVRVKAVVALTGGGFAIGGYFDLAGGNGVNHVARWTGSGWSSMGFGFPSIEPSGTLSYGVTAMNVSAGAAGERVIAGVAYTHAPTFPTLHGSVAEWNGSTWDWRGAGLGNQFTGGLYSLTALPDGGVFVGGGLPAFNHIAKWNGASWISVDGGMDGSVYALHTRPDMEVIAGGTFQTAGGQPAPYWARFGGCPVCDGTDFNGDGLYPDTADIDDFLSVFSGGPCSTGTCGDIDYNNDGLFPDTLDIDGLLSVFSGGPCL